jgi:molecular chaperone GrpE
MSILEREGLKRFSGVGKEFDPRFHEAVEIKETEKYPPNHIISEIVCGYKLNDRIIRPAKVIVSKKPSKK